MRDALFACLIVLTVAVPARAGLIRQYELNNSFADALGGPSLVDNGGVLGATGYSFDFAQGLRLTNPGVTDTYTIDLTFSLGQACNTKYCKVVDFSNLTTDLGMYTAPNNALNLFNVAIATAAVGNDLVNVLLSRNAAGTFSAYLNGVLQFSVNDGGIGVVGSNVLWFFQDEGQQGNPGEYTTGFVDSIRIYDTPDATVVPEPGSLLLCATGVAALGRLRRRRGPAKV